ncbi:hypothetical protein CKAH01_10981 [Colletotrichum kahawae]|uniref:Uncharacterized protein n=1 Tax=Colletotrichum kahawae TaxID=34407 RepID=A0AAD9XX61_COLKA|nr:hypothetical protein CKAH01_10981 [Colletotrichum kahawae]
MRALKKGTNLHLLRSLAVFSLH